MSAQCPVACGDPATVYIASIDNDGDGTACSEFVEICYYAPCGCTEPQDLAGWTLEDAVTNTGGSQEGSISLQINSGSLQPGECVQLISTFLVAPNNPGDVTGTNGSIFNIGSTRNTCTVWNNSGDNIFLYNGDEQTGATLIDSETDPDGAGGMSTFTAPTTPCPTACMTPACSITIDSEIVSICNDNGTGADPSDDTFTVTVTATVTGGSGSYFVMDNLGNMSPTNTSGAAVTMGPYPANNVFTIFFTAQDGTDATCTMDSAAPSGPVSPCSITGPPNSLCDDASVLPPMDGTYMGTTVGATEDLPLNGDQCPQGGDADALGAGVWYTFQGTGNDWTFSVPATFDGMCDFDPEINIYSGTCDNFTCVTGDDDGGGGLDALATVTASVIGTTYYLYVHDANSSSEDCFTLNVMTSPPPISPDCLPNVGTFTKN